MTDRQAAVRRPTVEKKFGMRLWLTKRPVITALVVWFATRTVLYLIATEHLFHDYGVQSVGDVGIYANWARQSLYFGHIPNTTEWQYPPLLAPILVFPQWLDHTFGVQYLTGFTAMTFTADAVITAMLLWTARRRDSWRGVWYWIVSIPLLGRGAAARRRDGTPGVELNRRRWLAGVLIGFGTAIKIWPGLTVFGMPRTKRGWQTIATILVSAAASIGAMSFFFTGTTSWVGNQGGRGIEIESLWAMPWIIGKRLHLDHVVTQKVVYGSYQIEPSGHGLTSTLIALTSDAALVAQVLAFGVMIYWWWRKAWRPIVVADSTFVATSIFIVTSRVISPQYLIWLLAVGGFCLLHKDTTQRRSTRLVLMSLPLTAFEFPFDFGSYRNVHITAVLIVLVRNLLLVAATYYGFRDLWVSTVAGPFLTPRVRALLHLRPAPAPAADAAGGLVDVASGEIGGSAGAGGVDGGDKQAAAEAEVEPAK